MNKQMEWTSVDKEPVPRDGDQYLIYNMNQGGVLSLIFWNKIHKYFSNKGKYVDEANIGTHWIPISLPVSNNF